MVSFSKEKYSVIVKEIRHRIVSSEIIADKENIIFIEATVLQIRKILELISYLAVLTNSEKLNSKERGEYHASKILKSINSKTNIYYPFPSRVIPADQSNEPVLIPIGYLNALSQDEFHEAYKFCGSVLHAQHPLKEELIFEDVLKKNKEILKKLKGLLQFHTIGVMKQKNKYMFLYVEIDFSNNEKTQATTILEFHDHISREADLVEIFNGSIQ